MLCVVDQWGWACFRRARVGASRVVTLNEVLLGRAMFCRR